MMNSKVWFSSIIEIIADLSDPAFQKRVWVEGAGPEVSSWSETYCTLFDDFVLDKFLDEYWPQHGLSEESRNNLETMRQMLNDYVEKATDKEIISDPAWHKIQKYCASILPNLRMDLANAATQEHGAPDA